MIKFPQKTTKNSQIQGIEANFGKTECSINKSFDIN